eukprot:1195895-Prorocentrum_minimum.AAC.6
MPRLGGDPGGGGTFALETLSITSGTATTRMPAASPPSTPAGESSTTTHRRGSVVTPLARIACKGGGQEGR